MKKNFVEVYEEWRDDWQTPDVFVFKGKGKNKRKHILREHTLSKIPFIKFRPYEKTKIL